MSASLTAGLALILLGETQPCARKNSKLSSFKNASLDYVVLPNGPRQSWPAQSKHSQFSRARTHAEAACPFIRNSYRCSFSGPYGRHFNALPPLDRTGLLVHSDVHLLLYGSSYIRQTFQALLCNNPEPYRFKIGETTCSGRAGYKSVGAHCGEAVSQSNELTTAYLPNGARLTGIFNNKQYQDTGPGARSAQALVHKLKRLAETLRATHVAIMEPHAHCYFAWEANKNAHKPCIALGSSARGPEFPCNVFREVFLAFRRGGRARVLHVRSFGNDRIHPLDKGCVISRVPAKSSLAFWVRDRVHPGQRCCVPHSENDHACAQQVGECHQCQPGDPEYVALEVMRALGLAHSPPAPAGRCPEQPRWHSKHHRM